MSLRNTLVTLFVVAAPRAALACPVCFGQNDSPMAKAANLSIVAMLVVVAGVLAGFASFFIHLMRRARLASDEASGPADSLRQGYGGPPQRGSRVGDPGGPPIRLRQGYGGISPKLQRRRKLHAKAEAGRHALQGSNPQEGTAQC